MLPSSRVCWSLSLSLGSPHTHNRTPIPQHVIPLRVHQAKRSAWNSSSFRRDIEFRSTKTFCQAWYERLLAGATDERVKLVVDLAMTKDRAFWPERDDDNKQLNKAKLGAC